MSQQYRWLWRYDSNCCAHNFSEEWQIYSESERHMIEEAYQKNSPRVELGNNVIDLITLVHVDSLNPDKQRSIKRILSEDMTKDERFSATQQDIVRERNATDDKDSLQAGNCLNQNKNNNIHEMGEKNESHMPIHFESDADSRLKNSSAQPDDKPAPGSTSLPEFEWITDISRDEKDIESFVILSGAPFGLSSVGFQNLVRRYTNITPPGCEKSAWQIIEPHFSVGPPRIRFKAVLDIIQQHIDPNLSILDELVNYSSTSDGSHNILAMLACTSTVITTDFNNFIEDAGRVYLGSDPNIVPFDVFFTEDDFKKGCDLINSGRCIELRGLWKIHGTAAVWREKEKVLVRADDDGGPVVTLKKLSFTRESNERRRLLQYLLETRPFIVINYASGDDFDVTRWLKTAETPFKVLWIHGVDKSEEPVFWTGINLARSVAENIGLFDEGLIAVVRAWNERGIIDRLTIVTTSDPVGFLLQVTHLKSAFHDSPFSSPDSSTDGYLLSQPKPWQSFTVSGAILAHLSYFREAKLYFDYATSIAIEGTREYCIARLAAAEASVEIGDIAGRIQAMNDAADTEEAAPPSMAAWANKKSRFISAKVKRFIEKDGMTMGINELKELLNDCGKPDAHLPERERNVALEAAILLTQLRRYVPSSPEPSDTAQRWIEAIPKSGLLQTKGMNLHEQALQKYQMATNVEELDSAICVIKEAIEIREQIGHMRGLVASLNVLGSMQMRRADWNHPFEASRLKYAAEQFRNSVEYSDKHASVFDQFQARIHLAICLLRFPSVANNTEELFEILNYFEKKDTDDLRTKIESEFCLAMSVFIRSTSSSDEILDSGRQMFDNLTNKFQSYNDSRLVRILAAARFNSELCKDWKNGQRHKANPELTKDIVTRKLEVQINAYWLIRISRAETDTPNNNYDRVQLLLDPLSP